MSTENIKYVCNRKSGDMIELHFEIHQRISDHIRKNTNLSEEIFESNLSKDNVYTYRIHSAGFEPIMKSVIETIEKISNEGNTECFCNHLLTDFGKYKCPRVFHDQMKNEYGLKDEKLEWWVALFFIGLSGLIFDPADIYDD